MVLKKKTRWNDPRVKAQPLPTKRQELVCVRYMIAVHDEIIKHLIKEVARIILVVIKVLFSLDNVVWEKGFRFRS